MATADQLKAQGNAAFSAGKYQDAIELFTKAIEVDPNNHVLYSNRSAAEASIQDYDAALVSAQKCVQLKPDWPKGYSRLGAAHHGLGQWGDAIRAYEDGLKLDPSNEQMQSGLTDAKAAQAAPPRPGGMFSSPEVMTRLAMDPRTRALLGTPDFMSMLSNLQNNPQAMGMYMQNPKFQLLLEVALGLKMGGPPGPAGDEGEGEQGAPTARATATASATASTTPQPAKAAAAAPAPKAPEPEPVPMETESTAPNKAEALKAKEAGNQAYKARKFEEAIQHYNRALELYDEDISFLTNRAAVYYEMGRYDTCIEDCEKAVERGREVRADFKLVAKALARKASALVKQDKLEEAIQVYNKSLMEHRNADTLKKLNDAEKALKERKEKEYINMDLCNEEKDKGNQAFKEQKYPEAVAAYTEALKRGPPAVNPDAYKLYSNLAACYTKLGAYPEGVKAADKCIELAPTFVKGYSRKGALQFFMKEYDKALLTYRTGLTHDPNSEELMEGADRCLEALSKFATGQASADEIKDRQARSMQDPEIQSILKDPIMQQVLNDFQEDPRGAQKHLKAPEIMAKINKLVSAGIIQIK